MDFEKSLQKQLDNVIRMRHQLSASKIEHSEIDELDHRIERMRAIFNEKTTIKEAGGCPAHPLGNTPHLNASILYHLECCNAVVENINCNGLRHKNSSINPFKLVYPTIMTTLWRRLLSLLIQIRINDSTVLKQYNYPKFNEVIYLKMPQWFDSIFRKWYKIKMRRRQL